MLELKNINKGFGKGENRTEILEDINLQVEKGELVVLYGPSGSGKSTLLSIIGALLEPSNGEIMMDDENWTHHSNSEMTMLRQKEIGFIFQQSHLLPYLKVVDQLVHVGMLAGMKKKDAKKSAKKLLTTFGLEHRLNNYPKSLSGGEQQRVAIARAFMNRSEERRVGEEARSECAHESI